MIPPRLLKEASLVQRLSWFAGNAEDYANQDFLSPDGIYRVQADTLNEAVAVLRGEEDWRKTAIESIERIEKMVQPMSAIAEEAAVALIALRRL